MYSWVARNILAKMLDSYRGTETMRCLDRLEKSQWWSGNDILELQNERLRRLVNYAYDNVPYYGRVFRERKLHPRDIKGAGDLAKLPELNKHLARSNFDDMKSRIIPEEAMVRASTEGSTGEPFTFYTTKEDEMTWGAARSLRASGWAGKNLGDKEVIIHNTLSPVLHERRIIRRARLFLTRSLDLDPVAMSLQNMSGFIKTIEDFNPRFLSGYPSAVYMLAGFVKSKGKPGFRPISVLTGGEQLYDHQRVLIEEVFGCRVYNVYAAWEAWAMAGECSEHNGLHVAAEDVILEIVDDSGMPLPAGTEGRILLTNLHNYAMPFIRYEIGDRGMLSDRDCPCGRGLPMLCKLTGRTTDYIQTKDGHTIPGIALPVAFLAMLGVIQVQVLQESYDEIIVRIILEEECAGGCGDEITKEIKAKWQPILGEETVITVQFVDKIDTTTSGKRHIIISKLPAPVFARGEQENNLIS